MKVSILIEYLQKLESRGITEISSVECGSEDGHPWDSIKGDDFELAIPHESNKIGEPCLMITKREIFENPHRK